MPNLLSNLNRAAAALVVAMVALFGLAAGFAGSNPDQRVALADSGGASPELNVQAMVGSASDLNNDGWTDFFDIASAQAELMQADDVQIAHRDAFRAFVAHVNSVVRTNLRDVMLAERSVPTPTPVASIAAGTASALSSTTQTTTASPAAAGYPLLAAANDSESPTATDVAFASETPAANTTRGPPAIA